MSNQQFIQDFSVEGSIKCLESPAFEGRNGILLLGKARKFCVIFQKYALKFKKVGKLLRNFEKKRIIFRIFLIFRRDYGKNKEDNIDRL